MEKRRTSPLGPPTAGDLTAFDWASFASPGVGRACVDLWYLVNRAFEVAEDESTRRVLRLLFHVLGLQLRPDDDAGPLVPLSAGFEVSRFEEADEHAFRHMAALPNLHRDLYARLLDILWLRRVATPEERNGLPSAYVAAADAMMSKGDAEGVQERFARAWVIAREMKSTRSMNQIEKRVAAVLHGSADALPTPTHLALVRLQKGFRSVSHRAEGDRCTRWAKRCARSKNEYIPFTRAVWETAAECYAAAKLTTRRHEALREAAKTYLREARAARKRKDSPASAEAHFLERAIHALRRLPGTAAEREKLHRRLLSVQKQRVREMRKHVGPSIDLSDLARHAIDSVSGKGLRDALFAFVVLDLLPNLPGLRDAAQAAARQYPLSFVIPRVTMDEEGRRVSQSNPPYPWSGNADEGIRRHMHDRAQLHRALMVRGAIEPAQRQIVTEHAPDVLQVAAVLNDSPFVPENHFESWARGIHAGLRGNWVVCGHILLPQAEAAIRRIVEANGGRISTLRDDGIQEWVLLTTLLESSEARAAFGEDYLFALDGILGRERSNLRNEVAHGMLKDASFRSSEMQYLWWLLLALCLQPAVVAEADERDARAST